VRAHPLLDGREVVLGDADARGELEVVVEAVLDRRADRDAGARIEVQHRGGEHVRGVVADELERVRRALRDDLDLGAVRQRGGEVAHLAVDLDRQGGTGEPGADRRRQVGAAGALVEVAARAVGEPDFHAAGC
jgi:hypothetical protein